MKIIEYLPTFCERSPCNPLKSAEAQTLEEVKNIDWIKKFEDLGEIRIDKDSQGYYVTVNQHVIANIIGGPLEEEIG